MRYFKHQCIHEGITTENNIIFFRIWRYFSHRASILCLDHIFFLHQHSLCDAACYKPLSPSTNPMLLTQPMNHFLCNLNSRLLIKPIKHVMTAMLGMNEAAVALSNGSHITCTHLSCIHFVYLLLGTVCD